VIEKTFEASEGDTVTGNVWPGPPVASISFWAPSTKIRVQLVTDPGGQNLPDGMGSFSISANGDFTLEVSENAKIRGGVVFPIVITYGWVAPNGLGETGRVIFNVTGAITLPDDATRGIRIGYNAPFAINIFSPSLGSDTERIDPIDCADEIFIHSIEYLDSSGTVITPVPIEGLSIAAFAPADEETDGETDGETAPPTTIELTAYQNGVVEFPIQEYSAPVYEVVFLATSRQYEPDAEEFFRIAAQFELNPNCQRTVGRRAFLLS